MSKALEAFEYIKENLEWDWIDKCKDFVDSDKARLEVIEKDIDRTELYVADEAFYCGTGAQVSPITKIDNRPLGTGSIGEVTKRVQDYYFELVKGNVEKYKNQWCVPVYAN